MKKSSFPTSTIAIILIVIIALIGYFYYRGKNPSSDSSSLLSTDTSQQSSVIGSQVLGLLNQIQALHIDSKLFTDPGYQTLRDYSVPIPPENVGRANPFAPLPGAPAPTSGSSSTGN